MQIYANVPKNPCKSILVVLKSKCLITIGHCESIWKLHKELHAICVLDYMQFVCYNHVCNVAAYTSLLKDDRRVLRVLVTVGIVKKIYLFHDSVNLIISSRNKPLIFHLLFCDLLSEELEVSGECLIRKSLLDIHDVDRCVQVHLRAASKLTAQVLVPAPATKTSQLPWL